MHKNLAGNSVVTRERIAAAFIYCQAPGRFIWQQSLVKTYQLYFPGL